MNRKHAATRMGTTQTSPRSTFTNGSKDSGKKDNILLVVKNCPSFELGDRSDFVRFLSYGEDLKLRLVVA